MQGVKDRKMKMRTKVLIGTGLVVVFASSVLTWMATAEG